MLSPKTLRLCIKVQSLYAFKKIKSDKFQKGVM